MNLRTLRLSPLAGCAIIVRRMPVVFTAFTIGALIGFAIGIGFILLVAKLTEKPVVPGKHVLPFRRRYPRVIERPQELVRRVRSRPTNIDQPPSEIRRAQFRRRGKVKDE